MSEIPNQKEIENQVKAHIKRLKDKVDSSPNKESINLANIDPKFFEEDDIALNQVNNILKDSAFKKNYAQR